MNVNEQFNATIMKTAELEIIRQSLDRLEALRAIRIECREEVEAELIHALMTYKTVLSLTELVDTEIWGA